VVARTEKRGDGGTCDEVCQRVLMVGMWSMESGGRYFVGTFGKILAGFSPLKHVFAFNLLCEKLYNYYTFNIICKDNRAVNFVSIQHKKDSVLSTFIGHSMLVLVI
jgi:hypothetical protein